MTVLFIESMIFILIVNNTSYTLLIYRSTKAIQECNQKLLVGCCLSRISEAFSVRKRLKAMLQSVLHLRVCR